MVLSAVAAAAPIAEYRDDKLTVHMARTPITECVRALESATGASIRGRIPDKGEVTIALESVPLREGLGRIFGESNFTITYKNDGRPSAVQVLGGPLPVLTAQPQAKDASPPPSNGGPADAQTVAQARVTLQAFMERNPSLELDHQVAAALGRPRATLHDVLRTAADSKSKRVRSHALMLSLRTFRDDSTVWGAFTTVVGNTPVDSMSSYVKQFFGPHAEETARVLASQTDPDLSGPAKAVLDQLVAQP